MRQVRHPLVRHDIWGIFNHVLTMTHGDVAAADRRVEEIVALLADIAASPRSGQKLSGGLSGWRVRHGGRGHKLTVVFRFEPEEDLMRIAVIAFGGRDWMAVAEGRRD